MLPECDIDADIYGYDVLYIDDDIDDDIDDEHKSLVLLWQQQQHDVCMYVVLYELDMYVWCVLF